jgi:hypothetical protein
MSAHRDLGEVCIFCRHGHIVKITREMTFHQTTDRGRITCCIALPVNTCSYCGFQTLDRYAEAVMDQAVRREYDKLPRASGCDD